jgi:hypothetical protein
MPNQMPNQRTRNRQRSKRRSLYCPRHGCYLDSVSRKYNLFADQVEQLQQRGLSHKNASLVFSSRRTVSLTGEWVEEFWCNECQSTEWYHVRRLDGGGSSRAAAFHLAPVAPELWQQVTGAIEANGNPSVGEFTRTQAKATGYRGLQEFNFVR